MNEQLLEEVFKGNIEKVKELLDQGTDINCINERMENALLVAIGNHNIPMIQFLLDNGAVVHPAPQSVYTLPLNAAVDSAVERTKNNTDIQEDSVEVIQILLKYGADCYMKDRDGESAYGIAQGYHIPAQELFEAARDKITLP